jgi:hypothetical protein
MTAMPRLRSVLLAGLALTAGLAAPARASLPEQSCFVLAMPAGAVDAMSFRVRTLSRGYREQGVGLRFVHLDVILGRRGQGLRDEVAGKTLTQELVCDTDAGSCAPPDGGGALRYSLTGDVLTLTVTDLPVGDFGNSMLISNLVDPVGTALEMTLIRARDPACDDPLTPTP